MKKKNLLKALLGLVMLVSLPSCNNEEEFTEIGRFTYEFNVNEDKFEYDLVAYDNSSFSLDLSFNDLLVWRAWDITISNRVLTFEVDDNDYLKFYLNEDYTMELTDVGGCIEDLVVPYDFFPGYYDLSINDIEGLSYVIQLKEDHTFELFQEGESTSKGEYLPYWGMSVVCIPEDNFFNGLIIDLYNDIYYAEVSMSIVNSNDFAYLYEYNTVKITSESKGSNIAIKYGKTNAYIKYLTSDEMIETCYGKITIDGDKLSMDVDGTITNYRLTGTSSFDYYYTDDNYYKGNGKVLKIYEDGTGYYYDGEKAWTDITLVEKTDTTVKFSYTETGASGTLYLNIKLDSFDK